MNLLRSSIKFSTSQASVFACFSQFVKQQNHQVFILGGYAGTGKTFMLSHFCKYLSKNHIPFRLLAPTGRASRILQDKTAFPASTIHRHIIKFEKLEHQEKSGLRFHFNIKENTDPKGTVYIVDEASMVGNTDTGGEVFRFGTGKLLNDFLNYASLQNRKNKIIFCGDPAQLPPVGDNFSPALSPDYLSKKFGLKTQSCVLKEVIRQSGNSKILAVATQIRNRLESGNFAFFPVTADGREIIAKDNNQLSAFFNENRHLLTSGRLVVIAHSNARCFELNRKVRQQLFYNKEKLQTGDRLVITQNNYSFLQREIFNGEFASVEDVASEPVTRKIPLGGVISKRVELRFVKVTLRFEDATCISAYLLENHLYSESRDITQDELKALFIDFKIRNNNFKPDSDAFKNAIRTDPYFNCIRAKYGYAVTCHKAQGGEWDIAMVDFFQRTTGYEDTYRWMYTAVTRASKQLVTLNLPETQTTTMKSTTLNFENTDTQKVFVIEPAFNNLPAPKAMSTEREICSLIWKAVKQCINNTDFAISNILHRPYREHYLFENPKKEKLKVEFLYNGKDVISKIGILTCNGNNAGDLYNRLRKIEGCKLLGNNVTEEILPLVFPANRPFLKEFYQRFLPKLKLAGIAVKAVEHLEYMERYTFTRNGLTARMEIYYNGRGKFTRFVPQARHSTCATLLNEVCKLVKAV
ncbi:MAG: hypothetical protein CMO01_18255 [Thalassobius sp.]|nr:hypothetical protein [Thalassovita sp.]